MMLCPTCGQPIPVDDINIAADTAMCRGCRLVVAVSSVVHGTRAVAPAPVIDLASPPRGAYYRDDGVETVIGATTRSGMALFLVPFMAIWSGGSLGGIYGSQIVKGQFDLTTSLFGIPFLLGTLLLGSIALMSVGGRVEVRLRHGEGTVFTGFGPLGRKQHFDAAGVRIVREDYAGWSSNRQPRQSIVLEGAERLAFASLLSEPRRYFVKEALRQSLGIT